MNMQNDDRDWLDERLAVENYIQDDGFTGRVISRLPNMRSSAVALLRWRILFISALLSTGLLALQIGPLTRSLTQLFFHYSPMDGLELLSRILQQPNVIYGGAGCVILLGFASIPFLRRWA
jgi:hypothetical protein